MEETTFWDSLWAVVAGVFTDSVINFIINLIIGFIVLIVGIKLVRRFVKKFFNSKKMQQRDKSVIAFMRSFTTIALYILIVIIFATIVGVPMASITAAIASAGLAIGLALQGSLSNLAGGMMILLFKPYKIGDYVVNGLDAGTVCDINLFYTELATLDNSKVVVPNAVMSNSTVTNNTAHDTRRLCMEFEIAYSSDIEKARSVILECVNSLECILTDAPPEVPLLRQDASSLVLQARVWCNTTDYWKLHFALNESVKNAFDKHNIDIPFPQMDIHVNPKSIDPT